MPPEQLIGIKVLLFAILLGGAAVVVLVWERAIDWVRQDGLRATTAAVIICATALTAALGALAYLVTVM